MQTTPSLPFRVVPPTTCRVIRAFGDELILHLGASETGGRFSMWTNVTPPGGGPPPHYHLNEDEWFFPLEGRPEFFLDGKWTQVPLGTAVYAPVGSIHSFRNAGDETMRMLIQTAPGGFENFFDRCAAVFAGGGELDMDRIVTISAEFGIHYVN